MIATMHILALIVLVLGTGCNESLSTEEYRKWLYSSESGLAARLTRSGRVYSMTLLPQTWRKTVNPSASPNVTVLLTITPSDPDLPDASFEGITSLDAYSNRVADIAYHVKQMSTLVIGEREVKAIGAQHVHTQSLKPQVSVYIVFDINEDDLHSADKIAVHFDDRVFGEGRLIYQYRVESLEKRIVRSM